MSVPNTILAFLALGLSLTAGASDAPVTGLGSDPFDRERREIVAAMDAGELRDLAERIEAVTELRSAIDLLGADGETDLGAPLHDALGILYDPSGFAVDEVPLDHVRSLVEATQSLRAAEEAADRARVDLRRAITNL
ncbi:MAG: hypothetical protein QNK05_08065 [Myxococcota bacterium]|nr:hypothetical protein [Myxococcota bacterium]